MFERQVFQTASSPDKSSTESDRQIFLTACSTERNIHKMKKSLFASLIGRPNTGKSTLLNNILGEKVSIVSSKPQTTRNRITGIKTVGETQYVFLDTPGVHTPKNELGSFMMEQVNSAGCDSDVNLFLVASGDRCGEAERGILDMLKTDGKPVILLVNKTDISDAKEIGDTITRFSQAYDFAAVIPISAKNGSNVKVIFDEISKYAVEGPWYFPDDMYTDQPERAMVAEIVREKLLLCLGEEIPHGTAVVIEAFEQTKTMLSVRAEIFCEKTSHKPIIIGKNGEKLKRIGTLAREDLEKLFRTKVYINLWVKIKENWRDSKAAVSNFGYKGD